MVDIGRAGYTLLSRRLLLGDDDWFSCFLSLNWSLMGMSLLIFILECCVGWGRWSFVCFFVVIVVVVGRIGVEIKSG